MEGKKHTDLLQSEWIRFNSNLGALYTFFENLVTTADKLDQDRKRSLASGLAELFGDDEAEIEKEILQYSPSLDDLDVFPDFRTDDSVREMMREIKDESFLSKLREWEKRHPHKSHKLTKLIFSLFGNPPISGFILRKSLLITLVTFFEVLIESMYVNHYLLQGHAEEDAIEKAEMLNVRSWYKRLDNLREIGLPTEIISLHRQEILELINLRNLLVHKDGIVDQDFLDRSSDSIRSNLRPGNALVVSTKRLRRLLDLVFSYGLVLCQSHWRVYEKESKLPNAKIEQLLLTSFDEKRYSFVIELIEKLMLLDLSQDIKQRLLVDKAIAYREMKRHDELRMIVEELERSTYDWQIALAISMLKNDYKAVRLHIEQALSRYGSIQRIAHWPLFEPIKNEPWFRMAFLKKGSPKVLPTKKRRK